MSKYVTQDVILNIPDHNIIDSSTNLLQFPKLGTNLVINRFRLPPDYSFEQAVNEQIQSTKRKAPSTKLKFLGETELGKEENKISGIEYSMSALVEGQFVQQYQFYCLINNILFILSYGKYIPVLEGQSLDSIDKSKYLKQTEWQHLKDNFELSATAGNYVF